MIKLRPDNCQDCRFWVWRLAVDPTKYIQDTGVEGCLLVIERNPEGQCEVGIRRDTKEK